MIIARITMGLGNQMFQYAAALALSLEKNVPLKVDTSSYAGYKLRQYELDTCFTIDTAKATETECSEYVFHHPVKRIWNKIIPGKKIRTLGLAYEETFIKRNLLAAYNFFSPPHKLLNYQEPHYHFDKHFFDTSENVYLHGYWMSWKYFQKYEQEVRNAFTIRKELIQHLETMAEKMQQNNSVAIHIRRTDFTDNKIQYLKTIIPVAYYVKAIALLKEKYNNISLYFFSDDIDWVKQNVHIENLPVYYIDKAFTSSAIEDFYLMTQCRHNIIANSTFSWWAAYLNAHQGKTVIAPKKWYSHASHYNYKDVYPLSWMLIDA